MQKSKSLLGRTGIIKEDTNNQKDVSDIELCFNLVKKLKKNFLPYKDETQRDVKDFWNISNDEYYNVKFTQDTATVKNSSSLQLQVIQINLFENPTHETI